MAQDGEAVFLHGVSPGEQTRFHYTRLREERTESPVV